MSGRDEEREERLRRAALTAASGTAEEPTEEADEQALRAARDYRLENLPRFVDMQVRQAMERGEFDDLPGAGKPIRGLTGTHDPDWWVKSLIEREQLSGMAPPAIGLRKEHAELDDRLDREVTEEAVRRVLEDFNARVVEARRQLLGGPPVVTPTRDVDAEVAAWHERRARRREEARRERARATPRADSDVGAVRRRWWRRRTSNS